jgi:hypothetical protein
MESLKKHTDIGKNEHIAIFTDDEEEIGLLERR